MAMRSNTCACTSRICAESWSAIPSVQGASSRNQAWATDSSRHDEPVTRPIRLSPPPSDAESTGGHLEWGAWLVALALVTGGLTLVRGTLGAAHVVLTYLLVVLGASARGGRTLGLTIAVAAFGCFNFFF